MLLLLRERQVLLRYLLLHRRRQRLLRELLLRGRRKMRYRLRDSDTDFVAVTMAFSSAHIHAAS